MVLIKLAAMKVPHYLIVSLLFLVVGCSDFQKALKSEDLGVKNDLAQSLYDKGDYRRASQLFEQLKGAYRGKPQAERYENASFERAEKRTKFSQYLLDSDKRYQSTIQLGVATSTADAEGDELSCGGGRRCCLNSIAEMRGVGDHMVRRCHQHQRAWRAGLKRQSGGANRGGSVLGRRFDQDVGGGNFKRGELLDHDEAEISGGYDRRSRKPSARQTPRRGLIKALVPYQLNELLRVGLARQRPKPRAGAAT